MKVISKWCHTFIPRHPQDFESINHKRYYQRYNKLSHYVERVMIKPFPSNNCTGFRIIPRFWFVINQKIIKFLVFSSWQRFRLTLSFCWWCGKLCFCSFDDLIDTTRLISSSVSKPLLYFLRLFFGLVSLSDWFDTSSILSPFYIS